MTFTKIHIFNVYHSSKTFFSKTAKQKDVRCKNVIVSRVTICTRIYLIELYASCNKNIERLKNFHGIPQDLYNWSLKFSIFMLLSITIEPVLVINCKFQNIHLYCFNF